MVQSILRAHPPDLTGPAELLAHVNRHLCHKQIGGFVTAFLGIYEPATRHLVYACAGHPPPLMKASNSDVVWPLRGAASFPLGIDPNESFAEAAAYVLKGDTILLYTDGFTEARSARGDFLSIEPLEQVLRQSTGQPGDLIERACELVRLHEHDRALTDDQTLVVIRGA
jgi:sigma-B regulation protein RsbU (phosphoserine phosphatase)